MPFNITIIVPDCRSSKHIGHLGRKAKGDILRVQGLPDASPEGTPLMELQALTAAVAIYFLVKGYGVGEQVLRRGKQR